MIFVYYLLLTPDICFYLLLIPEICILNVNPKLVKIIINQDWQISKTFLRQNAPCCKSQLLFSIEIKTFLSKLLKVRWHETSPTNELSLRFTFLIYHWTCPYQKKVRKYSKIRRSNRYAENQRDMAVFRG